jgi:phosphoribosylformylglycinamidine synthase
VTALAIVPDVREAKDSAFLEAGSSVYLLGITRRELGGSIYWKRRGVLGARPPRARPREHLGVYRFLHEAMAYGVRSAHDLSEGGLAVAAAEMAFGGGIGLFLDVGSVLLDAEGDEQDLVLRDDEVLFSESLGRILVEVDRGHEEEFTRYLRNLRVPLRKVGETLQEPVFVADGVTGDRLFELPLDDLEDAWRSPLAAGPLALAPQEGGRA